MDAKWYRKLKQGGDVPKAQHAEVVEAASGASAGLRGPFEFEI